MNPKSFHEAVQMHGLQKNSQLQNAQLKQRDIFDEFRQAKADYDDACRQYARVCNLKEQTANRLSELSKGVAEVIQAAMQEPTVPQPTPGVAIGNASNERW